MNATRHKDGVKRIRFFFINCPTLDTDAAAYLLLAQNKQQSVFQFEVHHFWIFSHATGGPLIGNWNRLLTYLDDGFGRKIPWFQRRVRAKLDLRAASAFSGPLTTENWCSEVQRAISKYDDWVDKRSPANNLDSKRGPSIVITETRLGDHFISFGNKEFGIISAGEWKLFFKPASALEYILISVQRMALRVGLDPMINSHFPTRACIFDYTQNQPDLRHAMFLGFICETCRNGLKISLAPEELAQIDGLVENQWIGDSTSTSSIAFYLSKIYRYEVSRATGLNPGFFGFVRQQLQTGLGQALAFIGKWAAITVLSALAVALFPRLVSWIHTHLW